ncbi:MAG: NUDIX hydrolase [Candidatus Ornithospirochaeta sp.]
MEELIREIECFNPGDGLEEKAKERILRALRTNESVFLRDSVEEHMTASSWIVSKDGEKCLMVYHNIYDSWSWTGGHADGDENLLSVALKEAKEETGVDCTPLSRKIFSLEVLPVEEHVKRGKIVPFHHHLNVTYLLTADEETTLKIKEDENSGVMWMTGGEMEEKVSEKWMVDSVYKKLVSRTKEFLETRGKNVDGCHLTMDSASSSVSSYPQKSE